MTATRRETILAAMRTALTGTTGVSTRIYRSRVEALSRAETPAILIEPVSDSPTLVAVGKLNWDLTVRVSVVVRGAIPDQQADPVIESLHAKLLADKSLGGYAQDLTAGPVSWEFVDGDQPVGVVSCDYRVQYRTSETSLTTT
jgi:hypothetical protein